MVIFGEEAMNILLIDDEAFALKLLARQLANLGFEEIIPWEHARDALAALESGVKAIDLVFCDLQMPRWTAWKSCATWRASATLTAWCW
jgi:CheY-like chemotaxis protein